MQIFQSNSIKKIVFLFIFIFGLALSLEAKSCDYRTFNIKVNAKVSTYEILNQLSSECNFSMISLDSVANSKLNEKLYGINIKNMKLKNIFSLLISSKGLRYKYENHILKIGGLITRTFKIDYVNSERKGSSNTDISMNGDTGENIANNNTNTNSTNSVPNSSTSGSSSQTTGATITSSDNFQFWNTIQKEILQITNSPLDKFKAPRPIINKEAGLITVSGTATQVKRVGSYLDEMMRRLHKQVMIDVKILSVRLNNSKSTGIDWTQIYKLQNVSLNYESLKTNNVKSLSEEHISELGGTSGKGSFFRVSGSVSIQNILNFLHSQGNVSSMSNPKVTTLNNQPAIFSSGDQLYYKILQSVSNVSSGGSSTGQNEVVRSVFAGVLLDITPEITDNNEIILKLNPSISSVSSDMSTSSTTRNMPPDLKKQQMSAVVKVKDGERVILGGLITSMKSDGESKVPILGNIPILGKAFRHDIKTDVKDELVIIITPHIINFSNQVSLKTLGYKDSFEE